MARVPAAVRRQAANSARLGRTPPSAASAPTTVQSQQLAAARRAWGAMDDAQPSLQPLDRRTLPVVDWHLVCAGAQGRRGRASGECRRRADACVPPCSPSRPRPSPPSPLSLVSRSSGSAARRVPAQRLPSSASCLRGSAARSSSAAAPGGSVRVCIWYRSACSTWVGREEAMERSGGDQQAGRQAAWLGARAGSAAAGG